MSQEYKTVGVDQLEVGGGELSKASTDEIYDQEIWLVLPDQLFFGWDVL